MLLCSFSYSATAAERAWRAQPGSMLTEWGEAVTPKNAWREYPRPQMVRSQWTNLNGLWNFAVTKSTASKPKRWARQILVPFALETPLSGIGERLPEGDVLWYQKRFRYNKKAADRTLLNFEGVDYSCRVWVNDIEIGTHTGGNLPFSFDISAALKPGNNEIVLRVVDDTDSRDRYQLRGKQKRNNSGIWYTPSSGIWQTVWLEDVPQNYIAAIKTVADMNGELSVNAQLGDINNASKLKVSVFDGKTKVAEKTGNSDKLKLRVKQAKLWSPQSPKLYDLKVQLLDKKGKVLDSVDSYVGFRSVGKVQDKDGHWRFTLNGKPVFHLGPLDQGWWPDGFLNPPADEAIVFEMKFLKQAGFNMIRKHKKVEPRRYYYHADRLGFLIWQDQVSGGAAGPEWPRWFRLNRLSKGFVDRPEKKLWWRHETDPVDALWPDWAHFQYMDELKSMIDTLHNNPSVVVWTTFNERWGQHRSMKIGKWTQQYDPTRLLNIASGGNFFEVGDIADHHQYPHPMFPLDVPLYDDYVKVVGEFGGHGWTVENHQWDPKKKKKVYGDFPKSIEEYRDRYVKSMQILGELKSDGVAAGVYTQTTDVEIEINGLMTYDRKYIKISAERLNEIHTKAGLIEK